ncbi:hypothetical protein [Bradyrhizobium cenepequi]
MSHRPAETEDPFIADFAVAMDGVQIKTGSLCRSEVAPSTIGCSKSNGARFRGNFYKPVHSAHRGLTAPVPSQSLPTSQSP